MNRTYLKALASAFAVAVGGGAASAQNAIPFSPWVELCIDPTVTNPPTYSTDFNAIGDYNDLFGCVVGLAGKVAYSKVCFGPNGINNDAKGRFNFFIGPTGSIQDVAIEGQPIDDFLGLNFGALDAAVGCWSYAWTTRKEGTAATKASFFGKNGWSEYFNGASDRYFFIGTTNDDINILLRVDIRGDGARLNWQLTNTGNPANIGMGFGQWIAPYGPQGPQTVPFVDVPGFRPLTTDHRFVRGANLSAQNPKQYELPHYVNFGITQSWAYGLKITNDPDDSVPDQTPVDNVDIGKVGFILGSSEQDNTPAMRDFSDTFAILEDTFFGGATAYVQRWFGTPVAKNGVRNIISYYRSTSGVDNFAKPYAAVIDGPKVVALSNSDVNTFNPATATIRVYLDNTAGFSTVDQTIPLSNVRVTLSLPPGITTDNGTSTKTQTVARVNPQTIGFTDFTVNVGDNVFGVQQYNVTIEPNPGASKNMTATINVASKPRLQIRPGANLVGVPWQFNDSSWGTVLGASGLQQDVDFQAFAWDAQRQTYVVQSNPDRGYGSFVIARSDVPTPDAGFRALGGSPQQPTDLAAGMPPITLYPGWNLIANPYNYSIPISQIVGVGSDNTQSYRFEDLVNQGVLNSSLAYWDNNTQSYRYTASIDDLIVPNRGYWIYVNAAVPVTIAYPPVYAPFIPSNTGGIRSADFAWRLNLQAKLGSAVDDQTTIGAVSNADQATKLSAVKPPMSPMKNAIQSAVVSQLRGKTLLLGTAPQVRSSKSQWTWQVQTRAAGPASVSWPNVATMPSNLKLTLVDTATGIKTDMTKVKSYSFLAKAAAVHTFTVVAETDTTVQKPVLSTVSASQVTPSATAPFQISYNLSTAASTTVRVLRGNSVVATVLQSRPDKAGTSIVYWNQSGTNGRRVLAGSYSIEVTSAATNRTPETKTISVVVR